jgi:hypothetical protein
VCDLFLFIVHIVANQTFDYKENNKNLKYNFTKIVFYICNNGGGMGGVTMNQIGKFLYFMYDKTGAEIPPYTIPWNENEYLVWSS